MYSYKGCIGYQVAKAVQITKKNVVTVKFGQYVSSKEIFYTDFVNANQTAI